MATNGDVLKRGIFSVLLANLINLVINLLTNFIMPKYLSVDSYAAIKTYQLYISYAGVISLGFVDGMFLKYGGVEFEKLDKNDLNVNLSSFRIFQIVATIIMLLMCIFIRDNVFIAFVLTVLPVNMAGYFRSLYQSIGEFQKYSKIMNATTGLTFIANVFLLFIVKTDDYSKYLFLYVLIDIIIWIMLEVFLVKSCKYKFKYFLFSFKETIVNIKDGILLMLGNFSNTILTSMDRWFIKILMDNVAFAQYSFACSMENFVNVAVTPITVTLYNYFCRVKDQKQIKRIRNMVILFASFLIICAFPGKFILETFLVKYYEATKVMFYLFDAQLFYIIIKSIYVNLYKAQHKQKRYFIELIIVIGVGFVFNVVCYLIMHQKESFAVGTLLSAVFWLLLSARDFPWLKYSVKEICFIVIVASTFLFYGYKLESIIGFLAYLFTVITAALILMKDDFIDFLKTVCGMLKIK